MFDVQVMKNWDLCRRSSAAVKICARACRTNLLVSEPEFAIATIPFALNCHPVRNKDKSRGQQRNEAHLERAPDLVCERLVPYRLPALARSSRIACLNHEPCMTDREMQKR